MNNKSDLNIIKLTKELDSAILCGDVRGADELTDLLFKMRGGADSDAVMPEYFPGNIAAPEENDIGGYRMKQKSVKKIITIAAAAALVMALGITALATQFFGIRDMVIGSGSSTGIITPDTAVTDPGATDTTGQDIDLIAMQGYPDSNEYKANQEWNLFVNSYDTDHTILNAVGNTSNEYTEKYPQYLVYSKEMADKLEEIIAKYGLTLHQSIMIADNAEALIDVAGVGNFFTGGSGGVNTMLGGYVYNDGTFQYDGDAVLESGARMSYQFGRYVKGTFSSTYLNIGNADSYNEWTYTTTSGVKVSLALSESKALIIADRDSSFVIVNVLNGTAADSTFGSGGITAGDLQRFADMFDYTQLK